MLPICLLLVLLKLLWAHFLLPWELRIGPLGATATVVAVTSCFLVLLSLPNRWMNVAALLVNLGISSILLGDLVYYRLFQDFPSLCSLAAAPQLSQSIDSIWDAVGWKDVLLLVDIPLLTLLWNFRTQKNQAFLSPHARTRISIGTLFCASSLYFLCFLNPQWFWNRYHNKLVVQYNGLLVFHGLDLLDAARGFTRTPPVSIDEVARVFQERRSKSERPEHFGLHRGKNMILVQLESMESFVVNLEIGGRPVTPFLNELVKTSLWGEAYDQTANGSSSDGEFIYLTGIHPPSQGVHAYAYPSNRYRSLPRLLEEYKTIKSMPFDGSFWNCQVLDLCYGFSASNFLETYEVREENCGSWGLYDREIFRQVVPQLLSYSERPFFAYIVTLMLHHPFEELPETESSFVLPSELEGTMIGRYLRIVSARDKALEQFVDYLKREGLWDDSIVVFVGDHRGRIPTAQKDLLKAQNWEHVGDKVLMVIHCPLDTPKGKLEDPIGQLDLLPTLLHLAGKEPEHSLALGYNLLAPERPPVVTAHGVVGQDFAWGLGQEKVFDRSQKEWVYNERFREKAEAIFELEHNVSDALIYGNYSSAVWEKL